MRIRYVIVAVLAVLGGLVTAPISAEPPPGPQPSFATFPGTIPAWAAAVDRQADGRLVVAGYASLKKQEVFALARFNADGTPDTTFGTDGSGTVTTKVGLDGMDSEAADVRVLPNGTIVAGGYAYWYRDAEYPHIGTGNNPVFALVGYTPQGVPDPAFGASFVGQGHQTGVALVEVMRNDRITALALNGSDIIATGPVKAQDPPGKMFGLAAFTSDGSLDTTFGDQGTITTRFAGTAANNIPLDVFVGKGGEIVVVGSDGDGSSLTANFAVARFTRDGAVHQESKTIVDIDGRFNAAYGGELLPDGKVVIAGVTADLVTEEVGMVVTRLNPSLSVDTSFATNGSTITRVPTWHQSVLRTLEVEADGGLLGAGFVSQSLLGPVDWVLVRYGAHGQLDPAFGTGGSLTTNVGAQVADGASNQGFDGVVDLLTEADGSNVAVGTAMASAASRPTFALVRFPTSSVAYAGPTQGSAGTWTVQAKVTSPASCQTGSALFETAAHRVVTPVTAGMAAGELPIPAGTNRIAVTFTPAGPGCLGSSSSATLVSTTPDPGPTPTPTPPVTKQKPLAPLHLPKALWPSGRTMLLQLPVRTNAGQLAKVSVRGTGLRPRVMGESRVTTRVIKRDGRLYVWLSGEVPTRVMVRVHAPATPGFTSYTKVKRYHTKAVG